MTLNPVFLAGILLIGISTSVTSDIYLHWASRESSVKVIRQSEDSTKTRIAARWIHISSDVAINEYFEYMDSLVNAYDSLVPYPLSEHLLVRANPWIIDTLANTDYYRMMARDSFVYDQRKMLALKSLDSIMIPDSLLATSLMDSFKKTHLDVNIR